MSMLNVPNASRRYHVLCDFIGFAAFHYTGDGAHTTIAIEQPQDIEQRIGWNVQAPYPTFVGPNDDKRLSDRFELHISSKIMWVETAPRPLIESSTSSPFGAAAAVQ